MPKTIADLGVKTGRSHLVCFGVAGAIIGSCSGVGGKGRSEGTSAGWGRGAEVLSKVVCRGILEASAIGAVAAIAGALSGEKEGGPRFGGAGDTI